MQIHELNAFSGTPSIADYLAIDDGTETCKVPATALGISVAMTPEEAAAGTSTEKRVITPAVLATAINNAINNAIATVRVVKVSDSISSLPATLTDSNITADMEVLHSVLSNPSAQAGDWTVTTSAGSLTISGSLTSGAETDITLYLVIPRT